MPRLSVLFINRVEMFLISRRK